MSTKTIMACMICMIFHAPLFGCPYDSTRYSLKFNAFNRSYWNHDTGNNYVTFISSMRGNASTINTDFATDYAGPVRIDYLAGYHMASSDSLLAYQQLFNGGGNASLKFSLPLVNFTGASRSGNFTGLVLNPRISLAMPSAASVYQDPSIYYDLGTEAVFNITGESNIISIRSIFRTAYIFGRASYISSIAGESSHFGYQTLSLQLHVKQIEIMTLFPVRIWSKDYSTQHLPGYIGLRLNY